MLLGENSKMKKGPFPIMLQDCLFWKSIKLALESNRITTALNKTIKQGTFVMKHSNHRKSNRTKKKQGKSKRNYELYN